MPATELRHLEARGGGLWCSFSTSYACWAVVRELKLSYYNQEALLLALYPSYGNVVGIP